VLFAPLDAQYGAALTGGVNAAIAQALAANAAAIADAMTLYFVVLGFLMMYREIDYRRFVTYCMRGAIVAALLVAATYQQLIADPAMNTIPTWLAQSMSGGAALNVPQQLDTLWSATNHIAASLYAETTGLENIAYREEAALINGLIGCMLIVTFFLAELSKLIVGVLVATLPFLLFFALFETTRDIPMRLAGTIVGSLVLSLMLSVLLVIILAADRTIILDQNNAVLVAINTGGTGIDAALGGFWALALTFFFGLLLLVGLPTMAAFIGGGVATHMAGALAGVASAGAGAVSGVSARAGRVGSKVFNRARGALTQ